MRKENRVIKHAVIIRFAPLNHQQEEADINTRSSILGEINDEADILLETNVGHCFDGWMRLLANNWKLLTRPSLPVRKGSGMQNHIDITKAFRLSIVLVLAPQ